MDIAFPDGMIDPHIHQWDPLTTPRQVSKEAKLTRFLPRVPKTVKWALPQAKREFTGDPGFLLKEYLPLDYRADAGPVPVRSIVHIEASWVTDDHFGSVDETRWVCGLPFGQGGAPDLGAIVVHADPRTSDVGAVLDAHLDASPLVRGVRYSAANHPDKGVFDFTDEPDLLGSADFVRGFSAVAERGLSFELWVLSHQLRGAIELAREYPEATFVLDHYATPVGIFGKRGKNTCHTDAERADLLARWKDDISEIAALPNVVAKHSGLGMPMLGGEPRRPITLDTVAEVTERCAPLIRHLHDQFGSERTMWASNFPIDKPVHSIPASIQVLADVLGDDLDPDLMFRDVARRVYRIGDA